MTLAIIQLASNRDNDPGGVGDAHTARASAASTPSHSRTVRQAPGRIRRSVADPPLIRKLDA
jgi:hypothetical protein